MGIFHSDIKLPEGNWLYWMMRFYRLGCITLKLIKQPPAQPENIAWWHIICCLKRTAGVISRRMRNPATSATTLW